MKCARDFRPHGPQGERLIGDYGGWSLDLASPDPVTGSTYDLGCLRTVARVKAMIKRDKPLMLIASPPCTYFSSLMNLSHGPSEKDWKHAVFLFSVAIDLCLYQARMGGRFILEYPAGSRAWHLPCVSKLLHVQDLERADFHMCQFGMTQEDENGCGFIFKPTTIYTNSEAVAERSRRRCCGGHRHIALLSGRAKEAQAYPQDLVDAWLDGVDLEMRREREGPVLNSLEMGSDMCDPSEDAFQPPVVLDAPEDAWLAPERIQSARQSEIEKFHSIPVYEYVDEAVAVNDPEAIIVDTRWVDSEKGSRLCAREFAHADDRDDLFSPTPPLVATKMVLSECATISGHQPYHLMLLDVKRAFLYAKTKRKLFIRLPREDPRGGERGILGRLLRAMYGTRDAPQLWTEEVQRVLQEIGFRSCPTQPCIFFHDLLSVTCITHVDDFLLCGPREALQSIYDQLRTSFTLKMKLVGPDRDEDKEGHFLGRRIGWTVQGLTYEADEKHSAALVRDWCFETCRGVATPGVNHESVEARRQLEELEKQ